MTRVLFDLLAAALAEGEVEAKLARVGELAMAWEQGELLLTDEVPPAPVTRRGYPPRPLLVAPAQVPQRKPASREGLAALYHAIVHIEWSAIDLALDHAYRFRRLPASYYADWIGVAVEEAAHFRLLRDHLRQLGYEYGDFPAHDGLWQLNLKTAHDVLARMALVPRFAEARGLDATPPIQRRLAQAGDRDGARLLDTILRDEIGHVALGDRWFRQLCAERGLAAEATYVKLMEAYAVPRPSGAMNEKARLQAGFTAGELAALAAGR